MLSVHEAIQISYSYQPHVKVQETVKSQMSVVPIIGTLFQQISDSRR